MANIRRQSKHDLTQFYKDCPTFKKYCLFNLWSEEFSEYSKIKDCDIYFSRYTRVHINNLLFCYFSPALVLIIYNSPCFKKFTESGFIKYIDFQFLLYFQENFFLNSGRSGKDIEIVVHLYFQRNIKKKFEDDFMLHLIRSLNELIPTSLQKCLTNIIKYYCLFRPNRFKSKLEKINFLTFSILAHHFFKIKRFLPIDQHTWKNVINKFYFYTSFGLFLRVSLKVCNVLYILLFQFNKRVLKSFVMSHKCLYAIYSSLPIVIYGCNIIIDRFCFLRFHMLGFVIWDDFVVMPLESYKYIYKDSEAIFEFTIEGLENFNYKENEIRIPANNNNFFKKGITSIDILSGPLEDLSLYFNKYFIQYSNKG